jgi:hypothetical protein
MIKSRRIYWADMGEKMNTYKISVGKPEEKRPVGRPMHKWECNIKQNLEEIGWEGVDCSHLLQGRD